MRTELFEWDDRKAAINLRKHRVGFLEAITVFDDVYALIEPDSAHSVQESREKVTGFSEKNRVLLVVYVDLKEHIRIISARKATTEERRKYESQFE
ncbi:MAG: BrnT family toxin [Acidobacteriota bacterium]